MKCIGLFEMIEQISPQSFAKKSCSLKLDKADMIYYDIY